MTYYIPGTGNGLLCNKCRLGAYDLIRNETYMDSDGNTTVTEVYRCRHCGHIWRYEVYRER